MIETFPLTFSDEDIRAYIERDAYEFAHLLFTTDDKDEYKFRDEYEDGYENRNEAIPICDYEQVTAKAVPLLKLRGIDLRFEEERRVLVNHVEREALEIKTENLSKLNKDKPAIKILKYEDEKG